MSTTYTETTVLATIECACCGVLFAIPKEMKEQRIKDQATFYCPSGHNNVYPKNDALGILKRQLAQAQTAIERKDAEINHQREMREAANQAAKHHEARAKGYKGALRKVEKRIRAGVCPCCKRTFQNLLQHMHTQHPAEIPSTHLAKP